MNILMPGHPDRQTLRDYVDKQLNPRYDDEGNIVSWTPSRGFEHSRAACEFLGLTPAETDASEAAWREAGPCHCDDELMLNLPDEEPDDDGADADLEPVAPLQTHTR